MAEAEKTRANGQGRSAGGTSRSGGGTGRSTSGSGQTGTPRKKRSKKKQRAIIKRRLQIMTVVVALLLILLLVLIFRSKKTVTEAEVSTLAVGADGTVTFEELTTLDKDYYDTDEMEAYVKDAIKSYNTENGEDSIRLEKFSAEGESVYLRTIYETPETYADFTNYPFASGTIAELKANGIAFDEVYVTVENGEKGTRVNTAEATKDTSLKAVVIRENVTVKVNGTVKYVTDSNTTVIDESTVAIAQPDEDSDAAVTSIIIYE